MNKYAIIVAGGSGNRMQSDIPKQFLNLHHKPILMRTLEAFYQADKLIELLVVLPESQISNWEKLCNKHAFRIPYTLVLGGNTRFQSVRNALMNLPNEGLVAIHDGVRPLVSEQIIQKSFEIARNNGSAIAAVKPKDSIRMQNPTNSVAMDRNLFYLVQTPQTFDVNLIKAAFLQEELPNFTDDASVFEAYGQEITLFEGDYRNIKITTPEDLLVANALLIE
jgi:2-C-methyl-D-erythritol 4-phosphate cytidylyltransferase